MVFENKLLIVGGLATGGISTVSILEFNTNTTSWEGINRLANGRYYLEAFLVPDDALNCVNIPSSSLE